MKRKTANRLGLTVTAFLLALGITAAITPYKSNAEMGDMGAFVEAKLADYDCGEDWVCQLERAR